MRESKTLHFQIKATGTAINAAGQEVGQVEAYGAMFNNVDDGNDRIHAGAFKRTILNSKSRAESRDKEYLLPMLWNHNTDALLPIGGWYDVKEDDAGLRAKSHVLLSTQIGREYYELAKAGMTDQFSIIYDIPTGGSHYDKSGVRELTELRLFSIDPVIFGMNEETRLIGVKSMDYKAVCGNTSGPIGPRDESWDGSAAEKWIWGKAEKDDGSIAASIAKKYFMNCDGDGSKKGDYGYPFWINDHINVGAVKAIAAAIQGARGASAPGGLKAKVEKLYRRINAKYPDADELTPPWKSDDGKRNHRPMERKDFSELYADAQAADALEDWGDLINTLTGAMMQAFCIGDEPVSDMTDALDQFRDACLKWAADAVECGMDDYVSESYGSSPAPYVPYNLRVGGNGYGYMSRSKAMMAGDATTGGFMAEKSGIDGFVEGLDKLTKAADKAEKRVADHTDALHDAADGITDLVGGTSSDNQKAGRTFSETNVKALQSHASALHDLADAHSKGMARHMKAIRNAADDLATVIQGSEAAYGTDPGTPDRQEGKARPHSTAPGTQARSSADTVNEEDVMQALSRLRAITVK